MLRTWPLNNSYGAAIEAHRGVSKPHYVAVDDAPHVQPSCFLLYILSSYVAICWSRSDTTPQRTHFLFACTIETESRQRGRTPALGAGRWRLRTRCLSCPPRTLTLTAMGGCSRSRSRSHSHNHITFLHHHQIEAGVQRLYHQ